VKSFLYKTEILVGGEYLANCRTQIYHLFGNNTRNVSTRFLRKADCIYVNWSFNCTVAIAKNLIAEVAEAKHQEGQDKTVLINISDAYETGRDNIHVIKDAIHYNELPWMIAVPIVNNEIEFSEWVSTLTSGGFSLRDKVRFERTAYRWKKQWIFREKATGRYWYYDYFHKDNIEHYEVFDGNRIFIGTSDTQGVLELNTDNNKKGRTIDFI
jgi:hypothetical protein